MKIVMDFAGDESQLMINLKLNWSLINYNLKSNYSIFSFSFYLYIYPLTQNPTMNLHRSYIQCWYITGIYIAHSALCRQACVLQKVYIKQRPVHPVMTGGFKHLDGYAMIVHNGCWTGIDHRHEEALPFPTKDLSSSTTSSSTGFFSFWYVSSSTGLFSAQTAASWYPSSKSRSRT